MKRLALPMLVLGPGLDRLLGAVRRRPDGGRPCTKPRRWSLPSEAPAPLLHFGPIPDTHRRSLSYPDANRVRISAVHFSQLRLRWSVSDPGKRVGDDVPPVRQHGL